MTDLPTQLDGDLVWAEFFGAARPAPALFLDRDGVIVEEVHYLHEVGKVRFVPGAADTIRWARSRNWHVVVVTNQSGIGRGIFDWSQYRAVHDHILAELNAAEAPVDAVMACPYIPNGAAPYGHPDHPDRKPNPGMLLKAAARLQIDLASSWIVGDRAGDIDAGRRAGLAGGIHVDTGHGPEDRDNALALAAEFRVEIAPSIAEVPGVITG